jgi:hypothetical protein
MRKRILSASQRAVVSQPAAAQYRLLAAAATRLLPAAHRLLPAMALLLALNTLAACDRPDPAPAPSSDGSALPAASAGDPDAATRRDAAGTAPAQTTHINVTLSEWSIVLDVDRAPAGLITLAVTNTGQYAHALEVAGGQWQTGELMPGETAHLELDLEWGTYVLSCPVLDEHGAHRDQGMQATLLVD